jgi:hypothetical protein
MGVLWLSSHRCCDPCSHEVIRKTALKSSWDAFKFVALDSDKRAPLLAHDAKLFSFAGLDHSGTSHLSSHAAAHAGRIKSMLVHDDETKIITWCVLRLLVACLTCCSGRDKLVKIWAVDYDCEASAWSLRHWASDRWQGICVSSKRTHSSHRKAIVDIAYLSSLQLVASCDVGGFDVCVAWVWSWSDSRSCGAWRQGGRCASTITARFLWQR